MLTGKREYKTLSTAELRERMRVRGIPVSRLAQEAQLHPPDAYRILGGAEPVGPVRRARIEAAIERLGLDREAPPIVELKNKDGGIVWRIRAVE